MTAFCSFAACGTNTDTGANASQTSSGATGASSGQAGSSGRTDTPPTTTEPAVPPVVGNGDCDTGEFELRALGTAHYGGKDYPVVTATPCEYVLSYQRRGVTYPMTETDAFYIVDSHFELPYIPGVMDTVAFTPGATNRGWAIGSDPKDIVNQIGSLPVLYHVRPGYEYGYFTNYDDGLGDIFGAFRPTWRFSEDAGVVSMKVFTPPDPDWPRHRGGWNPRDINQEIGFGFFIDENGKVYIPKNIPFGRQEWNDDLRCVVINHTAEAVPVTRTQFPGDESYYMAETFLPDYASISSPGHKYWGHKGKKMIDVAKWDDTLPGNFDKPYTAGCDAEGYNAGHSEGFTWPELRDKQRDRVIAGEIQPIAKESLYKISVYVQKDAASEPVLQGSLWYEYQNDEWMPASSGDQLISIDASRNTFRISGHLYDDQRAFIVIDDL